MSPFRTPAGDSEVLSQLRNLYQELAAVSQRVPEMRADASLLEVIDWGNQLRTSLLQITSGSRPRQARPLAVQTAPALGDMQFTADGGVAVLLVNATGAPTVRGTVVDNSDTVPDGVAIEVAGGYDSMGFLTEDGVADGELCWVAFAGRVYALLETGLTAALGDWARLSDTDDGRIYTEEAPSGGFPAVTGEHFREVGHVLSLSGDDAVYLMVHFN